MRDQPLGGNDMPRFAELGTMMRLAAAETADGLDACFVGVPLDIGTSNSSGINQPRHSWTKSASKLVLNRCI